MIRKSTPESLATQEWKAEKLLKEIQLTRYLEKKQIEAHQAACQEATGHHITSSFRPQYCSICGKWVIPPIRSIKSS